MPVCAQRLRVEAGIASCTPTYPRQGCIAQRWRVEAICPLMQNIIYSPAMEGGGHLSFNAEYNIQPSDSGWRQVDLGSLGSSERLPLTSKSGQMVKCCHLEADHQKLTRSCQGVTRISDADGSKCCHLKAGRPLSESAHSGQKLPSE